MSADTCHFKPTADADGWHCLTHQITMIQQQEPVFCVLERERQDRHPQTVLVGAEGMTEIEGLSWWRHATENETARFIGSLGLTPDINPFLDHICRPYWAIVVLPEAPAEAYDRAARYRRVIRLVE